ncbi:MAG: sulfoxide reductase heme-binding subunit YedZ [Deltaproteobacteria bacterium]|nr:sulfoxide reductase heme-binding subunit YedZ [Deltaproteobacteria bacterium]
MSAVATRPRGARKASSASDDTRYWKIVFFTNGLVPLIFLISDWYQGALGANPIDYVTRATGTLALLFLALTLAVTPLRMLTGWGTLNKLRRMVGLYAFFYTTLHLLTYLWWDQELAFGAAVTDVLKRKFIAVGLAAWLIMLPLAITSTNGMIKRVGGKRWKWLHRLTYVAAGLGVLHFYMLLKVPTRKLWNYGLLIGALLAVRIAVWAFKQATRGKKTP